MMRFPTPARISQWRDAARACGTGAGADGGAEERQYTNGDNVVIMQRWRREGARTILLVHGIGMGRQYFGLLREALGASADIVAIDLPGFGASPEPAHPLTMTELADLVACALRDAGLEGVTALGHSMGTQVVTELAVRHPDLVEQLVLIGPTINPSERSGWKQALRLVQDLLNDPPIVAFVGAHMYAKAGPRWFIRKLRSMLAHDIRQVLPDVHQPTLVVVGDEDRVTPPGWAQEVHSLLPDSSFRIAHGKGHEAMVSSAEPIAQLIREFLDQHAPRKS